MLLHVSDPGFWGVVVVMLVVGGNLLKFGAKIAGGRKGIQRLVVGVGVFLLLVGVGLPIAAMIITQGETVTLASSEGTQIEIRVETSRRLPNVGERVIVNPESARDLLAEWDTLSLEDKEKELEKVLADPRTQVWYKPVGSDEFGGFHWKDMLEEDKEVIMASIPEFTPMY